MRAFLGKFELSVSPAALLQSYYRAFVKQTRTQVINQNLKSVHSVRQESNCAKGMRWVVAEIITET